MGDSRDQTGEQLGPYYLDRRYEDLDEPGGQLYAAHNVETGRPALVLVPEPTDHWAPRSDWSVRVTSQVSPPFVSTELDRPPPPNAEALTDVDLVLIRMSGGIASVEDRKDANADFTQPHTAKLSVSPDVEVPVQRRTRAFALVAVGLLVVALALRTHFMKSPASVVDEETSHVEPMNWIDKEDGGLALGYPMPDVAFPEQTKPPCDDGEVEVRGGCWMTLERRAPCAKGTAEYQGKCYAPVRKKKSEPRSFAP